MTRTCPQGGSRGQDSVFWSDFVGKHKSRGSSDIGAAFSLAASRSCARNGIKPKDEFKPKDSSLDSFSIPDSFSVTVCKGNGALIRSCPPQTGVQPHTRPSKTDRCTVDSLEAAKGTGGLFPDLDHTTSSDRSRSGGRSRDPWEVKSSRIDKRSLVIDKDNGVAVDKDNGVAVDKDNGVADDKDNGVAVGKDNG